MLKEQDIIPQGFLRVTEVLQPFANFTHIDPLTLANAADRGERVHAYCEAYSLGLFLNDIDDDCKNYVEVFKRWFDETVEEVIATEKRLNSPFYRISGKFDMVAKLKGAPNELVLIDIKTPATPSCSWTLQTAAYRILLREQMNLDISRRICLLLPKVGDSVKIAEYTDHERDERLYLACLELYRFFNN